MTSTLKINTIEPEGATTTLTVGEAGQDTVIAGAGLKANVLKDAGGNAFFTSDGSGSISGVNSGFFGGTHVLLSSQTASGASSVVFTSDIDSTYDEYRFEFYNINVATDSAHWGFNLSTDGGSSYGVAKCSAYYYCSAPETGTYGSTLTVDAAFDLPTGTSGAGGSNRQEIMTTLGNGADEDGFGILRLYSPGSTTFMKMWTSHTVSHRDDDQTRYSVSSGYTLSGTSAVDAVRFEASTGNFDGKIKMYGIK